MPTDLCEDVETAQNLRCESGKKSRVSFYIPNLVDGQQVTIVNGANMNEKWSGKIENPNTVAAFANMTFVGSSSYLTSRLATLSVTIDLGTSGEKVFDACFLLDAPVPGSTLGPFRRFIKWVFRL